MIGVQDISKLQELCNWCDCGYWDEMFVAPFYQLSTYKLVDAQHEFKVLRAHVCIFRIQRTCCFCLDLTASSSLWLCSPAQCLGEIRPKNQENWKALSLSFFCCRDTSSCFCSADSRFQKYLLYPTDLLCCARLRFCSLLSFKNAKEWDKKKHYLPC